MDRSNKQLSSIAADSIQDCADLDDAISAAEDYERVLAVKMARLRRLILNMKCKRDALDELGALLTERRAAA